MVYFLEKITDKKKWYLFLLILSFILYGNTINNGYTIDDHYVTNNSVSKKGIKAMPEIFSSYYAVNENENFYEYRPIVKASFALEYELFKQSPVASHLFNILLYFVSLCLFSKFLRIFLVNQNQYYLQLMVIAFAILPVHTEVVASLKNRDILLCFDFIFLSIIVLNSFIINGKTHLLILSFSFGLLAFLSKIEVLPFLILVPVLFMKKYGFNLKKDVTAYLVLTFSYISFIIIRYLALKGGDDHHSFYNFERPLALQDNYLFRLSVGLNCFGYYLKDLLLPTDLSCYYGLYTIPLSFSLYFITGIIIGIALVCLFIRDIKKQSDLWLGILLFSPVLLYLQVLSPVPGIIADRFVFTASAGYVVIGGFLINSVVKRLGPDKKSGIKYLTLIGLVIITGYTICVIKRNREWKNNLTLYGSDVKKWPESVKLNVLYANEIMENISKQTGLIRANERDNYIAVAYKHMQKAYHLDSTYYNSLNTLAYIDLSFYNKPDKAVYWLNKAQKYDTVNYEIPLNLCLAYMRINNADSVEKYYTETLKKNPGIKGRLYSAVNSYYTSTGQIRRKSFFLKEN